MRLQGLPIDVLLLITDHLSPRSEYFLACACKALQASPQPTALLRYQHSDLHVDGEWLLDDDNAKDIRYIENVTIENSSDDHYKSDSLPGRKTRHKLIEAIQEQSLDNFLGVVKDSLALRYALAFLPRLRSLKYLCRLNALIWQEKEIWEASLQAKAFGQLTYLEIHANCPWTVLIEILRLPSLYSLYLKNTILYAYDEDEIIIKPVAKSSNLKVLQFADSIASRYYWQPILGAIKDLEIFAFDHKDVGGEPLDYDPRAVVEALIDHHSNSLVALRLHSHEYMNDTNRALWKPLSMLPKLRQLACRRYEIMPDKYDEILFDSHPAPAMPSVLPESLRELYLRNEDAKYCFNEEFLEQDSADMEELVMSSKIPLAILRLRFPDDAVAAACKVKGIQYEHYMQRRGTPFLTQDKYGDWIFDFNTFEQFLPND